MAKSNNTLLNTHHSNEKNLLISESDRVNLLETCDLLRLFICFSGSAKDLHLDSNAFCDVMEKIEREIKGVCLRALRIDE